MNHGGYPPGCTQEDVDRAAGGYDDPPLPEEELCTGCGKMVDPNTCGCGNPRDDHDPWSLGHHSFIPMGCDCGRAKDDESLGEQWQ